MQRWNSDDRRSDRSGYSDAFDDDDFASGSTGEFTTPYGSADDALPARRSSSYDTPNEPDEPDYEASHSPKGAFAYTDSYRPADGLRAAPPYTLQLRPDDISYAPMRYQRQADPFIIPGTGASMGDLFIPRRPRPLTMRIATLSIMACIIVSGLFAATPLGGSTSGYASSFQALSGAVILRADADYFYYTAQAGDEIELLATKFHVQIGGILELNNMYAEEQITIGKTYKIPRSSTYGADYKPPSLYNATAVYGATTYGASMWTSHAGDPPPEAPCGPDGHGTPTACGLISPNPGSTWVRGFSWYHNGVDMANTRGVPIKAAQAGGVIWAGWANDGFGFSVKINHCSHLSTAYGHMDALNVKVHDYVQPGDTIGFEGSTGWSTGPHVHLLVEVDNVPVDPMPYYGNSKAAITGS